DALKAGIAGLACVQLPEYSLAMLATVYENLGKRRTRQLERDVKALIERSPLAPKLASGAIAYIHDGMHVFANEAYINLFRYSDLDEILATPFMDMVAPLCRDELKVSLRACQKTGKGKEP